MAARRGVNLRYEVKIHMSEIISGNVNRNSCPSDLRITDIRFTDVVGAPMHCTLMKIYTNQGIVGLGEVRDGGNRVFAEMLKSRLIGENPCNVEKLFRRIKQFGYHARQGGGVCGVEVALWDLAGKAYGVPVYQMLGGKYRDKIRIYCDTDVSGKHTGTDMGNALKARMDKGFTFLKMDLGLGELFGATSATSSDVQGNFNSMQAGVASSTSGMVGSIGRVNSAKLNNKTATIKGTGNAIDGTAVSKIGETRGAIRDLDGKTVTVSVTGNAVSGSAKSNLDAVYSSINSLYSKTVNVHTNYTSSGFGQKATGAIVRRFASGAIFTKPTMTDVGLIGEAGAEAVYSNGRDTGIFPLTNRRYTGPFAREIADQLRGTMSQGNNNTFYIDGTGDPEAVADAVARRLALLSA